MKNMRSIFNKYRFKPFEFEAIQLTEENVKQICHEINFSDLCIARVMNNGLFIHNSEIDCMAYFGHIIFKIGKEYFPFKKETFHEKYEKIK